MDDVLIKIYNEIFEKARTITVDGITYMAIDDVIKTVQLIHMEVEK